VWIAQPVWASGRLMFKVLVLQALYNLSDDQAQFQIGDRLSFMRFLDMGLSDTAPDAKTIWLCSASCSPRPGRSRSCSRCSTRG
jgi:hypothetical protein